MRFAPAAAILSLPLAGCVPTKELPAGQDRERLAEVVQRFCAAERSSDPDDTAPLFVASIREMLDRLSPQGPDGRPRRLASAAAGPLCEPGRAWYRGGSRMFAEVRLQGGSDRLDLWRGEAPLIRDIRYGRTVRVAGKKAGSLREALLLELEAERRAPPPPPDTDCAPIGYHYAFVGTDTRIYRQGAVVRLTPMVDVAPGGTVDIPLRCTSDWSVSGPATLSADRTTLTIAPDAPAGAIVEVGFRHDVAEKRVAARFRVVGRNDVVLTGSRSQKSVEGCAISDRVGELEFTGEDRFAVTFQPFETYRDYWGTYKFDPAGQLRLKVEGGNFVPPGLDLDGEAELVSGRLLLKGFFLGSRQGGEAQRDCTYTF